jgi:hypothetical protein
MVFLQGSPLWSGALGHHIWLDSWRHKTKRSYHFIPWPGSGSSNPIPDWGHLIFTPEELTNALQNNGVEQQDIPTIVNYVYNAPNINRETARSIARAVSESGFIVMSLSPSRHVLPPEMLERLRSIYSDEEDWSIGGLAMVLSKP